MSSSLHRTLAEARARFGVPALGAALVDPDGPVEVAVVGTLSRHGQEPAAVEQPWHIGSCGKSMTAALYARLVEQEDAEWDTPVADMFPDLRPRIDPGWSDATVDDLLRCRAGVPANFDRRAIETAYGDRRPVTEQRTRVAAGVLARPPSRPGRFRYSNLGYVLVGAGIERITGTSYEESLVAHVLEPLGVGTAGFGPPPTIRGHGPRLQLGGLCVGAGGPVAPGDPRGDNPAVLGPAGRLHLGLADWARFVRCFLVGGTAFLPPATVDRLLHVPGGGRRTMAMGWAPARLPGVELGMQGSNTRWAATALVASGRTRATLVVANDGRTRNLTRTARLAAALLADLPVAPGPPG